MTPAHSWPHDDEQSLNAFYGNFKQNGWGDHHLTRIKPAFMMYYDRRPMTKGILVNIKCADAMLAAFAEIWDACGHAQHAVDVIGASVFGGCYNPRKITGMDRWSNHSWACAIDLDPSRNGFNTGHGKMDSIVYLAFKRQGALWGGDYAHRTDPMHFEFVSR